MSKHFDTDLTSNQSQASLCGAFTGSFASLVLLFHCVEYLSQQQSMNLSQKLQSLGLSSAEAQVYLACLEVGGGLVSEISSRAKVERTNCYYVLKVLSEKGLISISNKGSFKFYLAEHPDKIVDIQRQQLNLANELLPQLISLEQKKQSSTPKMRYYEGLDAVVDLYSKSLDNRGELLCYTNLKLLLDKFANRLLDHFRLQAELKLDTRIISSNEDSLLQFPENCFPDEYIKRHLQLLLVNPKEFSLQDNVFIYEDQVSVISLKANHYLGVLIESESYAETSRTTFNLAWLGATTFVAQ